MSASASGEFRSNLSPRATRDIAMIVKALDLGRSEEAERHLIGLLALYPDHPEVLRLFAGMQNLRGQTREAAATMRRVTDLRPNDALCHSNLGAVLLDDDPDAAIVSFSRACELDPKLASSWYNLGLALMKAVQPEKSIAALRRAIALSPKHTAARAILAYMLNSGGCESEAVAEYRRTLAIRPCEGMAWWGLATIKTLRFGDADIEALRRATHHPQAKDTDKIAMGFALAKALDERGDYAASLAELAKANLVARRRFLWNAAEYSAQLDALFSAFAPPPAGAEIPDLGRDVIFIVSMPRSGSTLIEQILASHSQVEGADELLDLPAVLLEETQRRGKPLELWAREAGEDDWLRLGLRYLERTERWRKQRPRFTDKLPSNWTYIGAIRAMLPGARIVVVRRDPLETCFSCYRHHFGKNEYTRTFADLAAMWRDFDRAARLWCELHPMHVYESRYERLIAEPEAAIRDLLAFCNLEFEPACLEFHKTVREVHTPSAAQVREPLRRDTARSPRYGTLLDPLRVELGLPPFAIAGGGIASIGG